MLTSAGRPQQRRNASVQVNTCEKYIKKAKAAVNSTIQWICRYYKLQVGCLANLTALYSGYTMNASLFKVLLIIYYLFLLCWIWLFPLQHNDYIWTLLMSCFLISKIFGDLIYKHYCWLLNTIFASQYLKSTLKAPQVAAHQLKKSDPKIKQEKGKKKADLPWSRMPQSQFVW